MHRPGLLHLTLKIETKLQLQMRFLGNNKTQSCFFTFRMMYFLQKLRVYFFHTFIMCSRSGLTITLHILHNISVVNAVTLFSKRSMQVCKKLRAPTGFVTPCVINFSITMKNLQTRLFLIRIPSVEVCVFMFQFLSIITFLLSLV